jgi:hypothetical protein
MLWMQWGALLVGLVALLFFAVFTGYYVRNRRVAMDARRRMVSDAVIGEAGEAGGPDGAVVQIRGDPVPEGGTHERIAGAATDDVTAT